MVCGPMKSHNETAQHKNTELVFVQQGFDGQLSGFMHLKTISSITLTVLCCVKTSVHCTNQENTFSLTFHTSLC